MATARERQIVGDENRGELVRLVQPCQEIENHLACPEIEISRGFIGKKNGWPADQSPGQYDPLLLPAR